jgi:ribose transport system substrate-binding protein
MIRQVTPRPLRGIGLSRGRPARLAISAAAVIALATACGSSAGSGASANSATSSASGVSATAGAAAGLAYAEAEVAKYSEAVTGYPSPGPALDASKVAALAGKTILFVPISAGAGPFIQQQAALESAFSRLGIKVITCDPNYVPSAAAACMGNAKTDGVAAVITSGIPYAVASIAYRSLEARGIPTLAANSGPGNPTSSKTVAYMPLDDPTATQGKLQADEIIAQSDGRANVLYVDGIDSPVLQSLATVTQGEFTKYCPDCAVVDAGFSTTNMGQLPSLVSSKLISNPSTDYIAIQADPFVPGVLSGVQSANFTLKVKGVGQTAELSILKMIQEGQFVISDVGVDSSYEGWVEADGILRLMTGQSVNPEPFVPTRIFDAENLKGVTLTPTTDIDALFGSLTFKDMFYRTWGVG